MRYTEAERRAREDAERERQRQHEAKQRATPIADVEKFRKNTRRTYLKLSAAELDAALMEVNGFRIILDDVTSEDGLRCLRLLTDLTHLMRNRLVEIDPEYAASVAAGMRAFGPIVRRSRK